MKIRYAKTYSTKYSVNRASSEASFGWDIDVTVSFDLRDLSVDDDIDLFSNIQETKALFLKNNFQLEIGCECFSNCKVSSVNFSSSNLTQSTEVSLSFISKDTRANSFDSLSNLLNVLKFNHLIENISDNYSFSFDGKNLTFDRNFEVSYFSGSAEISSEIIHQNAKDVLFAISVFHRPSYSVSDNELSSDLKFDEADLYMKKTMSIDEIGKTFSISQSYQGGEVSSGRLYSVDKTKKINFQSSGLIEKTYDYKIMATKEPLEYNANEALKTEIQALIDLEGRVPRDISKSPASFGGMSSFSITFDNAPERNGDCDHLYSVTKNMEGGFYSFEISGSISCFKKTIEARITSAKALYASESSNFITYINELFPSAGYSLVQVSINRGFSFSDGSITYSIKYTNDPRFLDGCIKKIEINKTDKSPQTRKNEFYGICQGPIIQESDCDDAGTFSVNVNIISCRDPDEDVEELALTTAKGVDVPTSCYIINKETTSKNPYACSYSASVEYTYKQE